MFDWVKSVGLKAGPVVLLAFAAPAAAQETTVVIVRHAEQLRNVKGDPPLSETGIARAEALRAALAHAGISAIITSDRARTQLTAQPLAAELGLTLEAAPVTSAGVASHIEDVMTRIRAHTGGTVLVVGHSNTIGEIAEALGAGDVEPVPDDVFDNFFVVTLAVDGTARLIQARYGAVTPPGAAAAH